MPEAAARSAARKAVAREAARRRQAVTMLQISEATCRYAAVQLGNGVTPAEARETALFVAAELETMAGALRRAVRLRPAERRALAVRLAGLGMGTKQIAATVGVSERAVWDYLHGAAGQPAR